MTGVTPNSHRPDPFELHFCGCHPSALVDDERGGDVTTTVAVIGATGTAGSRVVARLNGRGVDVVEICRSRGVDLISGRGLLPALEGVAVVIDVSNPMPADGGDPSEAIANATHNLVGACASCGIERLVVSTMAGIEDPAFDGVAYCAAKRTAERIALDSRVPTTIVKSTLWHECTTNPAAVILNDREVVAEDWLIQPIAADTVADVLVEAALSQTRMPRTITGPQLIRLPELVAKLIARQGDGRRIRTVQPVLTALAHGALLAADHAVRLGPDVDGWVQTLAPASPQISPPDMDSGELVDGPMA
jgi:uncharacterized protein YbjT (DUF2867 family)